MQNLSIRVLTTIEELTAVRDLEKQIWENDDPVPVHHLSASVKNGGLVLGAFIGEALVGFQYSFAGFNEGNVYLCSHNLGIHPAYRKQGIGEWAQKKAAVKKGYDRIIWTYDPLETVNGYLNLHKLGGFATSYMVNTYGDLPDQLNAGLSSDRLLVQWWIDRNPIRKKPCRQKTPSESDILIETVVESHGYRVPQSVRDEKNTEKPWFIPVPANFQEIKRYDLKLAARWRKKVRQAFVHCFDQHRIATDLIRSPLYSDVCFYVLEKSDGDSGRKTTG